MAKEISYFKRPKPELVKTKEGFVYMYGNIKGDTYKHAKAFSKGFACVRNSSSEPWKYMDYAGNVTEEKTFEGEMLYKFLNGKLLLGNLPSTMFANKNFQNVIECECYNRIQKLDLSERQQKEYAEMIIKTIKAKKEEGEYILSEWDKSWQAYEERVSEN